MKIKQGILKVNSLEEFLKDFGECLTVIDAKYVVDLDVVRFAVEKALKSWKEGKRIAKTLPLEILLYFCATRQIRDAIKVGVREGINEAVVVILNECKGFERYFKEKKPTRLRLSNLSTVC